MLLIERPERSPRASRPSGPARCAGVLALAAAASVQAGSLPSALGWYEIPNTRIRPLCPSDSTYPGIYGGSGCDAVTTAWAGGAFDAAGNRLLISGGGHGDWGGNEVYELDLDTLVMRRVNAPSYPLSDGCATGGVHADGRPVSRHTYNHLEYLPGPGLMLMVGGSRWQCGFFIDDTWTFDVTADAWTERAIADPGHPDGDFGLSLVRDPVSGLVYARDSYRLRSYDPATHDWTTRSGDELGLSSYKTAVVDPLRRRYLLYVAGLRRVYRYDISSPTGMLTATAVDAPTCAFMDEDAAGLAYSPTLDRVVAWNDGDTVWLLDPATFTCTTVTYPGGPVSVTNGTYGRFRYSPQDDVFVVCNDIDANCHALRLTPPGLLLADGFEG